MRNVKTNENKSIDVGDGLVEDHSGNSSLFTPIMIDLGSGTTPRIS